MIANAHMYAHWDLPHAEAMLRVVSLHDINSRRCMQILKTAIAQAIDIQTSK